ncbi:MAG: hypothetical protein ACD_75C00095G0002 [uncultured bacterium]|nr:MAG: hypothetical protein ACD_75C00095G0002 [uncultured bacterium]
MQVVDRRGDPVSDQHIGTAKARRPRADHRHPLAGRPHLRQVGTPAHFKGGIDDILFDTTDGHRAEIVVQSAGPLAEPVLGTDPSADFRQAVGLMAQFGRLDYPPLVRQPQPVGDIVMNRTFPFTVGVAAVNTAVGLHLHLPRLKGMIDLDKLMASPLDPLLLRIDPLDFDKLV